MARVALDEVSKIYDGQYAVKKLTLDVPDRDFLALVGPSGCGKTTTLRMLAGLEEISEGRVFIGDKMVNQVPPRDRDVAMVFQSYALYPHMSVYDNMAFGLSLRKMAKAEIQRRVNEAAAILGLEELLKRKPRQLSGGQRQRVALGRAIVRQPSVFLFDEPLSNLDAKLRVQTRAEINKLHQRLGTTFIYVTHDQVEAMTMANRIAVLREGELQQVGSPQELYDRPRNLFVAGFIASPSMNFLEAKVAVGPEISLEAEGFRLQLRPPIAHDLVAYRGRKIIAGIRPENIHDNDFRSQGIDAETITATVDVTELLGNEVILHLIAGHDTLLARVDPRTHARPGHQITVAVEIGRIYAFDPDTELAISPPTPPLH